MELEFDVEHRDEKEQKAVSSHRPLFQVRLEQEPDEKGFHLWLDDKTEVVVLRVEGELKVINSICPHMGAQMQCDKNGELLRCPWHGLEFSTSTLKSNHFRYRIAKNYRAEIKDGVLLVFSAGKN